MGLIGCKIIKYYEEEIAFRQKNEGDFIALIHRLLFRLVLDCRRKNLGLVDHLLDHLLGRDNPGEILGLVDLGHLGDEVGSNPMLEFLHGVNTGSLEKLRELRADTLDTEKIRMVDPGEDKLAGDTGGVLKLFTSLRGLALGKKLINGLNAGGDKLLSVDGANALNVDNLVSHFDEI